MSQFHEERLAAAMNSGREILVLDDKSVGGVLVAQSPSPVVAMIATKTSSSSDPFWSFPKGHPDAGESDTAGALREIQEEIGVDATDFLKPDLFDESNYTFSSRLHTDRWKSHACFPDDKKRPFVVYHKVVRFYIAVLPEPVPLTPQEAEVYAAEWVPLADAISRLTLADMRESFGRFLTSDNVLRAIAASDGPPS